MASLSRVTADSFPFTMRQIDINHKNKKKKSENTWNLVRTVMLTQASLVPQEMIPTSSSPTFTIAPCLHLYSTFAVQREDHNKSGSDKRDIDRQKMTVPQCGRET